MGKIKSIHINCLFFGACFIIIILSSMLLYSEYTEMFTYEKTEKAGIIIYKDKITQRKPKSEVIWEDIANRSRVFTGDTVRTGEDSSAVITLNNGTRISISENSMIRFFLAKDKLNIGFLNGGISIKNTGTTKKGDSGIVLKIRDNYIPAQNNNIRILENNENINITMSGSDGLVISKDGEYPVKDNETLVINNTGGIKRSTIIPILLAPEYDKIFITYSHSKEIRFGWESESKKNLLEISLDKNFSIIAVKRKTLGSSATVKLGTGVYYWRVKSLDRGKRTDTSSISKLTIIKNMPVKLYSPVNGKVFVYSDKPPMVDFKWGDNPLALKYELEISADKEFQSMIKSIQTGENRISADLPGSGTYYWRVKSKTGFNSDENREYIVHGLKAVQSENFEDIVLLKPGDKSIFKGGPAGKKHIFSCYEYNELDHYKLIISDREHPEMPVYDAVSKNNFLSLDKILPEGEYLWRIEGIIKDRGVVSNSAAKTFRIVPPRSLRITSPGNGSISIADEKQITAKVLFSWAPAIPEAKYLIRLFNDKKMNNLSKEVTANKNSVTIGKLKPGNYYWHIYILDNYKNMIIATDNHSFTVKKPLPAPVVKKPVKRVFDMLKINNIELSWTASKEADIYKISLLKIEGNKQTLLWEKETGDTNIVIENIPEYDKGNYAWTLQAFDTDDTGSKIIRKSGMLKNNFILVRKVLGKPEIEKLEIH